ncbi:hypothetical protein SmJEL517_g00151 [Synchytrium microbalum]|uniref:beta-glucosidase n=1 Tax=Synchytrium microbalum TaxID=1806994 RepID=A0A507CEW2_9FUNG|nr:uncharacterized protein SmJEL517_g00151 [Synchytrium microbalum]TPX38162.1 hypothetical protein SmJEL517_g00151 [Synchytrium microbalum]
MVNYVFALVWVIALVVADTKAKILYGAATSAYQVEGAANVSGRTPSIWDAFTRIPGKIADGSNGDVACDHYHKYEQDIMIMKDLGFQVYRFSLSWTRMMPERGQVNEEGVAFYNRLIDALIQNGITPYVTLYHWDLPQAHQEEYGGWTSVKVVDDFNEFATVAFSKFGDRVKNWISINEPYTFCNMGYQMGIFAPGVTGQQQQCNHNILLAHCRVVETFRTRFNNGRIGITMDSEWTEPYSNSTADVNAAENALVAHLGTFADPIFLTGDYPESVKAINPSLSIFTDEQKRQLKGSADFFGLNFYTASYEQAGPNNTSVNTKYRDGQPIGAVSDSPWLFVVPWAFRKQLVWIKNRYGSVEIVVTENGVSVPNETNVDVSIHDTFRQNFYQSYLASMMDAVRIDGVKVTTYMAWSFLDNFEWADGYSKRFGIVHVDFATSQRIPFEDVLVNPTLMQDVIVPRSGTTFIPVLVSPDGKTVIQDTTDIVDYLESVFPTPFPAYPTKSNPKQRFLTYFLEAYGDEWMKNWAMHYRWNFENARDYMYHEFGSMFPGKMSYEERIKKGGERAVKLQKAALPLGVTPATKETIELQLHDFLKKLTNHLDEYPYLLGNAPTLADYSFFGGMYAHLLRDPIPGPILKIKYPRVVDWIERVCQLHGKANPNRILSGTTVNGITTWKRESPSDAKYNLQPNDEIPVTLLPLLRPIIEDMLPFMITTANVLKKWLSEQKPNHRGEIPRSLAIADYHVTDPLTGQVVRGKRAVMPYELWMIQRSVDWYESCSEVQRRDIDAMLDSVVNGGSLIFKDVVLAVRGARVKRVNNLLVPDVEKNSVPSSARL